jgi:hypothetical protein
MEKNESFLENGLSAYSQMSTDQAASRGKMQAIISMIKLGLSLITVVISAIAIGTFGAGISNIGILLFSSIIGILQVIFLWQYSDKVKNGLASGNHDQVNDGLQSLLNYFKLMGIIFIIALGVMALFLLFGIGAAIIKG